LWLDGRVVVRDCPRDLSNSAALLPAAQAVLKSEGLNLADLGGIAFGMGPGSFTGLRVSCGAALGLALGLEKPLLGIGALDGMALAAGGERVIATLDARMGEVYYGRFIDGVRQGEIGVCPPACVPLPGPSSPSSPSGWLACGNGLAAYPALRARLAGVVDRWREDILPRAEFVARLAAPRLARGERIDPADAAPLYVRDKVAKTIAERLAEGGRA
jgi:tRNA threonylcarbamoyladenosine biosynthesis protein TsaB